MVGQSSRTAPMTLSTAGANLPPAFHAVGEPAGLVDGGLLNIRRLLQDGI